MHTAFFIPYDNPENYHSNSHTAALKIQGQTLHFEVFM